MCPRRASLKLQRSWDWRKDMEGEADKKSAEDLWSVYTRELFRFALVLTVLSSWTRDNGKVTLVFFQPSLCNRLVVKWCVLDILMKICMFSPIFLILVKSSAVSAAPSICFWLTPSFRLTVYGSSAQLPNPTRFVLTLMYRTAFFENKKTNHCIFITVWKRVSEFVERNCIPCRYIWGKGEYRDLFLHFTVFSELRLSYSSTEGK